MAVTLNDVPTGTALSSHCISTVVAALTGSVDVELLSFRFFLLTLTVAELFCCLSDVFPIANIPIPAIIATVTTPRIITGTGLILIFLLPAILNSPPF